MTAGRTPGISSVICHKRARCQCSPTRYEWTLPVVAVAHSQLDALTLDDSLQCRRALIRIDQVNGDLCTQTRYGCDCRIETFRRDSPGRQVNVRPGCERRPLRRRPKENDPTSAELLTQPLCGFSSQSLRLFPPLLCLVFRCDLPLLQGCAGLIGTPFISCEIQGSLGHRLILHETPAVNHGLRSHIVPAL